MNTDSRRSHRKRSSSASFWIRVGAVVGVLALLSGIGAVVALTQGPRLTNVTVDPAAAIEASGSRVILTTDQALATIDPKQVTVSPAASFTIDSQGRNVGVRFTSPLDDATTYTVSIAGATSLGGGPSSELSTSFTTPQANVYVMQRGAAAGLDAIVLMPVDGTARKTVFTHEHIEEFRVAPDALVISVMEGDTSSIIITDRDGSNPRQATLPGDGYVMSVQVSNRGSTFGYLFTDKVLSATEGRPSILYTASLRSPDEQPTEVPITGASQSLSDWMFVPDSQGILAVTWAGDLLLSDGGQPTLLGNAAAIDGISRGTYSAIVSRAGMPVQIDLRTGAEEDVALPAASGTPGRVEPATGEGELWRFTQRDESGMPTGNSIELVQPDGSVRTIVQTPKEEPILQFCVSPSAQYVAAIVAPNFANNPYDTYARPMPKNMVTRIVSVDDGSVVAEMAGFDISWCARSEL